MDTKTEIRELFIDELAQVTGGGPVEDVLNYLGVEPSGEIGGIGGGNTTMACCEEGPDGCC